MVRSRMTSGCSRKFHRRRTMSVSDTVTATALFLYLISSAIETIAAAPSLPQPDPIAQSNHSKNESSLAPRLFTWEDYSVLAAMLVVSCAIGIFYGYFGEEQTTSDEFLLGGSSMGTFPMALSLAASFVTAIELLGNPAEMYTAGAQFWMICIAFVLVVPITSQLFLPVYMRLRLTSCCEYLELRFCKSLRVFAAALYLLQMFPYTAVAVFAPALALSKVTGLHTILAVSLVYAVCIFYASQGGMKAVVMTDTFQSAVLIGSLIAVLVLGAAQVGGFSVVWNHARNTERLHMFDMNPDPTVRHSFWTVVVGGTVYWTSMFCANQASVQKYMSVERLSQARVALWVSAVGLIAVYTANFLTGAVLAAHYAHCDPIQAGEIDQSDTDRLLPLYVVRELGAMRGVPGFFVAGIFAASLGTVASGLNSMAAITCQDLANGLFGIKLPEEKGAKIARWVCLACGGVSFALVFVVEQLGPVLQLALSFNGMAGGISLGLFTLGMLFPWANSKGAAAGSVVGLALVVIAGIGAQLTHLPVRPLASSIDGCEGTLNHTIFSAASSSNEDSDVFWLFRLSYLWYSALGCATTLVVGMVVSVATGSTDPTQLPVDLLAPPVVSLLNSLPEWLKKPLRISRRLSSERRRSSSVRPPGVADPKDLRRRRRLSEMAGGVFYSDATPETPTATLGHDNLALGLDSEKPPLALNHNTAL